MTSRRRGPPCPPSAPRPGPEPLAPDTSSSRLLLAGSSVSTCHRHPPTILRYCINLHLSSPRPACVQSGRALLSPATHPGSPANRARIAGGPVMTPVLWASPVPSLVPSPSSSHNSAFQAPLRGLTRRKWIPADECAFPEILIWRGHLRPASKGFDERRVGQGGGRRDDQTSPGVPGFCAAHPSVRHVWSGRSGTKGRPA